MRLHYRFITQDGEVHEVQAGLQVAVAVEQKLPGKAFHEIVAGTLDDQLHVVHEAYCQGLPEGASKPLFPDWKKTIKDFQLDGAVESELPPLDEAERQARKLKSL